MFLYVLNAIHNNKPLFCPEKSQYQGDGKYNNLMYCKTKT